MEEQIERLTKAIYYMASVYVTYGGANVLVQVNKILNPPKL